MAALNAKKGSKLTAEHVTVTDANLDSTFVVTSLGRSADNGTSTSRKGKTDCHQPKPSGSPRSPAQGTSHDPSKSIAPRSHGRGPTSNRSETSDDGQTGHPTRSDFDTTLTVPDEQQTDDLELAPLSLGASSTYSCADKYSPALLHNPNDYDVYESLICRDSGTVNDTETLDRYQLEDLDSTSSQSNPSAASELFDLFSPRSIEAEIQGSSGAHDDLLSLWSKSTTTACTQPSAKQSSDLHTIEMKNHYVGATKHINDNNNFHRPDDDDHLSKESLPAVYTINTTLNNFLNFPRGFQLPQQLSFNTASLLNHYFSVVCSICSCFDSIKNPFRALGYSSSELIYNCALSMSGAHLSCINPEMKIIALNYQTQAISCLKRSVAITLSLPASDNLEELVIAIIMIGMSSVSVSPGLNVTYNDSLPWPWYDPSSLGVHHLQGGRTLFRKWLDQLDRGILSWDTEGSTAKRHSFLVGMMSYWEILSSFVMDQSLDSFGYLETAGGILKSATTQTVFPNPWTGICTPLIITLARLRCLLRQNQLIRHIGVIKDAGSAQDKLLESLLQDLQALEKELLTYKVPTDDMIEDTADPGTTKQTLKSVAQIYQLTGLLELYTQVPEVFEQSTEAALIDQRKAQRLKDPAGNLESELHHFGFRLAISILALIGSIPISSGANKMLMVPLLSAGSRLQPCFDRAARGDDRMQFHGTPLTPLADSLMAFETHRAVDDHWRQFVRSRIGEIHRVVRLDRVQQASRLMEAVWEIADAHSEPILSSRPRRPMYWMDVMREKRLETLLG